MQATVPLTEPDPDHPRREYNSHTRAVCADCGWHTPIITEPGRNLQAMWLDHAYPGWRDLPVIPELSPERTSSAASQAKYARWLERVEDLYPDGWGIPGAPIITRAGDTVSTRSVPGRSPWGGFDVAQTTTQLELPTAPSLVVPTIDPATSLLHTGMMTPPGLEGPGL